MVEDPGAGAVEQAQSGAVEELDLPEVDHDPGAVASGDPVQVRDDLQRRRDVDLAAGVDVEIRLA